ncbi:unnamed protein product [Cunninghamella blakesleeana]
MSYNQYNYQQQQGGYSPHPGGQPNYQQQQHQQQQYGGYQQQQTPYSPHVGGQNTYRPPPPQGQAPPPRPSAQNDQLYSWFVAVDTDRSGQLTVDELQRALVNGDWSPFNIETVRTMVNMFDTDNTGTIDFQEFAGLWKYIEDWKRCFQTFDADGSGSIDRNEMKNALRTFGYNLSDRFISVLVQKFDKYGKKYFKKMTIINKKTYIQYI